MEAERAARDAGEERRWRRYVFASFLAMYGLLGASMWLLHGWMHRRFDLPFEASLDVAALPGVLVGGVLIWAVARTRPDMDPAQRRRAAEAAEPSRRRFRIWLIVILGFLLLQQVALLLIVCAGGSAGRGDWGSVVVCVSMILTSLADILPSRAGTPPELVEFDQVERCEALRTGCLVLAVLGVFAAAINVRWPPIAAQAWLPVLLVSLMASLIRLATLPRRPARLPDATG